MGLAILNPPVAEPASLAEAKLQCRVTHDSEDQHIEGLVRAATRHLEKLTSLSLMTRTLRLTLDYFSEAIVLPRGPVQSVVAVNYVGSDGTTAIVSPTDYTVDTASREAWLVRNSAASWPATLSAVNVVTVDYIAGHDILPAEFEDLKHAILLLVGHWFTNREAAVVGTIASQLPLAVDSLIQPYRLIMI